MHRGQEVSPHEAELITQAKGPHSWNLSKAVFPLDQPFPDWSDAQKQNASRPKLGLR